MLFCHCLKILSTFFYLLFNLYLLLYGEPSVCILHWVMQTMVPACKALLLPDECNSDCDLCISEISHFSIFKSDGL